MERCTESTPVPVMGCNYVYTLLRGLNSVASDGKGYKDVSMFSPTAAFSYLHYAFITDTVVFTENLT